MSKPKHNKSYYLTKADSLIQKCRYEEATVVLNEGLSKYPKGALLWHRLGRCLQHGANDMQQALECFTKAYALDHKDLDRKHFDKVAMDFAGALTRMHRYAEAEAVYLEIYKRIPRNVFKSVKVLTALGDHYERRHLLGRPRLASTRPPRPKPQMTLAANVSSKCRCAIIRLFSSKNWAI